MFSGSVTVKCVPLEICFPEISPGYNFPIDPSLSVFPKHNLDFHLLTTSVNAKILLLIHLYFTGGLTIRLIRLCYASLSE